MNELHVHETHARLVNTLIMPERRRIDQFRSQIRVHIISLHNETIIGGAESGPAMYDYRYAKFVCIEAHS